ncbi:MAG: head-tail connector protein [Herbinix sp.]|nr:head-tail connector protein [Herbinix sp.]
MPNTLKEYIGDHVETEELKLFLRIDNTEDDILVADLRTAAEGYLANAGAKIDYENGLYKLAIKLLVSNWYENRTTVSEKPLSKMPFGLDTIIVQLCC